MSKSLIIVDIQPFYDPWHEHITQPLIEYVENSIRNNVYDEYLWFFNAEEVGIQDTAQDMYEYLLENGMDEEIIEEDHVTFIDKYYAFFRNWMDIGVDEEFLIKVIRYMISNDINDSRDIDDEAFEMLIQTHHDIPYGVDIQEEFDFLFQDNIHIPDFRWGAVKQLKNVDIYGGGRNECLKEMEILLEVVNVNVNQLDKYIYG